MKHIHQRFFGGINCYWLFFWFNEYLMSLNLNNKNLELCQFRTFVPVRACMCTYSMYICLCVLIQDFHVSRSDIPELFWLLPLPAFCLTLFGFMFKRSQTLGLLPSRPKAAWVTLLVKGLYSRADPANTLPCPASSPVSPPPATWQGTYYNPAHWAGAALFVRCWITASCQWVID